MPAEARPHQARHWFYLVPGENNDLRFHTAAKLVEKAWSEGHRVCVYCEDETQAQQIDEILWAFRPDAFIPHRILIDNSATCPESVGLQWTDPSSSDWQTVIVLGSRLPSRADQFERLALVANEDPALLHQARKQYRQLEALGINPKVHDTRRNRSGR